jgi:hypothetical protein
MKQSWKEKLDEKGLKVVELCAKLRQIRPLANTDFTEITRWFREQKKVLSAYPEAEQKRRAKLDPEFIPLLLRAHPEIELNEQELKYLFDHEELNLLRAEELELTQRITMALEADQTKRIEAYEAVAGMVVLLKRLSSGGLTKQLGTKTPSRFQFWWAIAQNLDWAGEMLRGNVTKPPGRFNVETANLADAILEHQREPLTQVELYEALKAAGAELPEDPEAFRLWLHRARKQGIARAGPLRNAKDTHSAQWPDRGAVGFWRAICVSTATFC